MKKYIYIALAAAAFASCSQDEALVLNQETIDFGAPFVENATRAADNTYSGTGILEKFKVYGTVTGTNGTINIFNGDDVTGTVGSNIQDGKETNVWNCDKNQYWIAGAKYNFAAVVDGDVKENETVLNSTEVDGNGMPKTITYATSTQKDLLYVAPAEITGLASGNLPVNFTFNHLLSKAMFTITSNTQDGYYYSVKDIKVNNFETGKYYAQAVTEGGNTISAGTWVGNTDKAIEFGVIEKVTAANNNQTCANQMLLIPNAANFDVTFTVELWNDNGTAGTADDVLLSTQAYKSTVSTDLVGGFAYNFKLDLTVGELIQFSVTSNPTWANGNTNDSNDEGTENDYVPLTPVAVNH